MNSLGSASDSLARRLFNAAFHAEELTKIRGLVAYDRIFGLPEREFEVVDVREAVATALRPQDGVSLEAHRTLLDLSRTRAGVARVNLVDEIVANSPKLLVALMCVILDDDAAKWPYHATEIVQRLAALEAARNEPKFEAFLKTASRRQRG